MAQPPSVGMKCKGRNIRLTSVPICFVVQCRGSAALHFDLEIALVVKQHSQM
jgi:hypothetical protein